MKHLGEHAIVIGGSVAGLMAARVLADHFERVTVLERDALPTAPSGRKSVPQGAHIHGLLLAGERVMSSLYPGFTQSLLAAGGVPIRAGRDIAYYLPSGKSYSPGGAMKQTRDLGFDLYGASRGLFEHCLRQHTQRLPKIGFETATVQGLLCDDGHVHGVRCAIGDTNQEFAADLVVDAGGRGSRAPQWLAELDFAAPQETVIGIDMAYASTWLRLPALDGEPERQLVFRGPAPQYRRSAILSRIENGLWHLTLAGRFGEDPPFDEPGFCAFAHSLHSPRLHQLLESGECVGEITQYQYPTSVRRHYECVAVLPERWLALGDAICSFNPIYGQGMTVAALQCQALQRLLAARSQTAGEAHPLERLGLAFFGLAAQVSEQAWSMAASQDFAFPQTRGSPPPGLAERAQYGAALDSMIPEDPHLHRLLAEVVNLAQPLSALTAEPLRSRVMARLHERQPARI